MPEIYVVEPTTLEIIRAPENPERRALSKHTRTISAVQIQMLHDFCLHPLGITCWGEHNGALWHKRGRVSR